MCMKNNKTKAAFTVAMPMETQTSKDPRGRVLATTTVTMVKKISAPNVASSVGSGMG